MVLPPVFARMEKPNQDIGPGINAADVRSFI